MTNFQKFKSWCSRHQSLVIILIFLLLLGGCWKMCSPSAKINKYQPKVQSQIEVTPQTDLASNFPLDAYADAVKKAFNSGTKNPLETLEADLNKENGINNIDIKKSGYINPLIVRESPNSTAEIKTINLFALPLNDQKNGYDTTFICSTEFRVKTDPTTHQSSYDVSVQGSPDYYQPNQNNNCYQSSFSAGDMLLAMWLFSPHPYYYSRPYYYGNRHYISDRSVYVSHTTVYRTNNRFRYNRTTTTPSYYNSHRTVSTRTSYSSGSGIAAKGFNSETKSKSTFNSSTPTKQQPLPTNTSTTSSQRTPYSSGSGTAAKGFTSETKSKSTFNSSSKPLLQSSDRSSHTSSSSSHSNTSSGVRSSSSSSSFSRPSSSSSSNGNSRSSSSSSSSGRRR